MTIFHKNRSVGLFLDYLEVETIFHKNRSVGLFLDYLEVEKQFHDLEMLRA